MLKSHQSLCLKKKPVSVHGFDPDAFLQKYAEPERPSFDLSLKGLARGAVKALPDGRGLLGGAAGLASPIPGGTVLGAGVGAAGGEALKQGIEQQFGLEEGKPLAENLKEIGKEGLVGAGSEAGGQILAKGIGMLPKALGRFAKEPKGNVEENQSGGSKIRNRTH